MSTGGSVLKAVLGAVIFQMHFKRLRRETRTPHVRGAFPLFLSLSGKFKQGPGEEIKCSLTVLTEITVHQGILQEELLGGRRGKGEAMGVSCT